MLLFVLGSRQGELALLKFLHLVLLFFCILESLETPLLLHFGQIAYDLVICVFLLLQFLLHALLVQIADLQLPHQLIHGITVEKLLVAHDTYITTSLLPWLYLVLFLFCPIRLNWVWPLLE